MISLTEINHFADLNKVTPETIEKDYIICWILRCLSNSQIKENFIFYGGTAIKRVYFEEHRYSEDIDLISNAKHSLDPIITMLESLKIAKEQANIHLTIDPQRTIKLKGRAQVYILYSGHEEILGAPKEIRLDFVTDSDLFWKSETKSILKTYSDFNNISAELNVMRLNSILANKLGLIIDATRNEPRDLFDIWFLLKNSKNFDHEPSEVLTTFKRKHGFNFSNKLITGYLNNPYLKKLWEIRLSQQIADLPKIEWIIKEIQRLLKKHFKDDSNIEKEKKFSEFIKNSPLSGADIEFERNKD